MPTPPDVRGDRPEPWRLRPGSTHTSALVAETQFRALLEAAPDAIVIADSDGRIVMVNRQTEVWFGYQREELLGQPVELLVPERFRSEHVGHRADGSGATVNLDSAPGRFGLGCRAMDARAPQVAIIR